KSKLVNRHVVWWAVPGKRAPRCSLLKTSSFSSLLFIDTHWPCLLTETPWPQTVREPASRGQLATSVLLTLLIASSNCIRPPEPTHSYL
ncbi:hypothetical protein F5H01DRAFT_304153, partial [Linnemannia elongata]